MNFDFQTIDYLIKKVIFNNPTQNCIVKGKKADWQGLPKTKSLFHAIEDCGLPIGNLTSQLFGNVYLNKFDHFVKHNLQCRYYGRYVDDFVIVHPSKSYLQNIIPEIRHYLMENLLLHLHPAKIYLQHYSKGLKFLGTIIKPYRTYINHRTKGNFYKTIRFWNHLIECRPDNKLNNVEMKMFMSAINSYLGLMKHFDTYTLRYKILHKNLSKHFWKYIYLYGRNKLVLKSEYKNKHI